MSGTIHNLEFGDVTIMDVPQYCPFCHRSIDPKMLTTHYNKASSNLEVLMHCTHALCKKSFIAYYNLIRGTKAYRAVLLDRTSYGTSVKMEFSKIMTEISDSFTNIYNQAFAAEQFELNDICGGGYRKALEFLIKEYAISNTPNDEEAIKNMLLGQCIKKYFGNTNIETAAKRAAWLGNDELHYLRKWENKDIKDMKKLIALTVHWIEAEVLTDNFAKEMPEGKK